MSRIAGDERAAEPLRGGVIALGNFDGFHRGHQAVVGRALELARARGAPTLVATFDPHPMRHFRPDTPAFRLSTLDQREEWFAAAGAQAMVVFGFDAALAALTAEQFVSDQLIARLGVSGVVTGEDFTFGHKRGGDVGVLRELGARHGFTVDTVGPVRDAGGVISSTRIRERLVAGDPRAAAALLTRPFTVRGIVERGDKVGRTLGYPTANLKLDRYLRPRFGIYAVRGRLVDGTVLPGAANLGIRPQFDPPVEWLEPYFLDWSGDLYDQVLDVELVEFLRPEARFADLTALRAQMAADCERARTVLGAAP